MCRSCFDKLSTNGGCNCPKLKTLYVFTSPFEKGGLRGIYLKNFP
ncbi:conserved hypothetical protein [Crenothrix polyspora]|uniref:Uncharacterized protein n=1 Tax=Crenothrix polyspora TaxID=360316 RepID=A0A1R4H8H7_9GAMM|nr:conserved hypothetical protein [Crenothrix polyspora]